MSIFRNVPAVNKAAVILRNRISRSSCGYSILIKFVQLLKNIYNPHTISMIDGTMQIIQ